MASMGDSNCNCCPIVQALESSQCTLQCYFINTNSLSLANFVGSVVGFLNVLAIRRMPAQRVPGSLLLAASLAFESERV
jgi:hypothetical protein